MGLREVRQQLFSLIEEWQMQKFVAARFRLLLVISAILLGPTAIHKSILYRGPTASIQFLLAVIPCVLPFSALFAIIEGLKYFALSDQELVQRYILGGHKIL
jgi:hypothetical protein